MSGSGVATTTAHHGGATANRSSCRASIAPARWQTRRPASNTQNRRMLDTG